MTKMIKNLTELQQDIVEAIENYGGYLDSDEEGTFIVVPKEVSKYDAMCIARLSTELVPEHPDVVFRDGDDYSVIIDVDL